MTVFVLCAYNSANQQNSFSAVKFTIQSLFYVLDRSAEDCELVQQQQHLNQCSEINQKTQPMPTDMWAVQEPEKLVNMDQKKKKVRRHLSSNMKGQQEASS